MQQSDAKRTLSDSNLDDPSHGKLDHSNSDLNQSHLGKSTEYINQYSPQLLFSIARNINREQIEVPTPLPFYGHDTWNAFELSWLNKKGKPMVAVCQFIFPCTSNHLIESKSFKLYLNSFNSTQFNSVEQVVTTLKNDLSNAAGSKIAVNISLLSELEETRVKFFQGQCLDQLDIEVKQYTVDPSLLRTENKVVEEIVYSNLLKSNCPVTGQPDWGSIQISYRGNKINYDSLLQYIISFREHDEFHEQCVERIFMDIMRRCKPEQLTVEARYTRRGGLDINPFRSTNPNFKHHNIRQYRQ